MVSSSRQRQCNYRWNAAFAASGQRVDKSKVIHRYYHFSSKFQNKVDVLYKFLESLKGDKAACFESQTTQRTLWQYVQFPVFRKELVQAYTKS